ncbi:amidase [Melaminivora suipulveris]|uniref:Amidase n=1 Tax=Melaminivora suipulveris TaxID=2109913 RepID=A0A2R3QAV5_9BURK|nr:amidase [Melaminivora suipulveris]AVO48922.1 amidase [Melaminivora suipulveris]
MTHDSSTRRTERALAAIEAAGDEGRRIFTRVYQQAALQAARAADERAASGITLGPLDGRIVSIKDLLDVAGEPTTAGSVALKDAPPAAQDAVVVQRLRAAGCVIIGKTNMTEFAFSGIGINPHYGTPGNAHDASRIPGGSSSGAGVSVVRGMAEIAIGTDTGGSIRIPAALAGIAGFKPTQARVPRSGALPLSYTLDTIGPLAASALDCARTDAVLAGKPWQPLPARQASGLRIGVPRGWLLSDADAEVLAAFERVLGTLSRAGARLADLQLDEWLMAPARVQQGGSLASAEAAHVHRELLARSPELLDPRVLARIQPGLSVPAPHYVGVLQARAQLQRELDAQLLDVDLLALPTVPILPPRIDELTKDDAAFMRANALVLRNPSVFNFYDLPALSLPAGRAGSLPFGLMLVAQRGRDRELLALAAALQKLDWR